VAPWKLPLIVTAIVVPIVVGILTAGPEAGLALGALVAVALVYVAVRMRPREGIGDPPDPQLRRRLLVVVSRPVEDPTTTAAIAGEAGVDGERAASRLQPPGSDAPALAARRYRGGGRRGDRRGRCRGTTEAIVTGKAVKIAYKPVGILLGMGAGAISGLIFKQVWKVAGHDDDTPNATDEDRSWTDVESDLATKWESYEHRGESTWEQIKDAARDAWDRVTGKRPVGSR